MRFLTSALAAAVIAMTASFAPVFAPMASAQSAQSATVIVLDYERIVSATDLGRNMASQLQAIGQQIQTELQPEQTALEAEEARIRQSTQGMNAEQVQANSSLTSQITQFGQRFEAFRARQVTASRDLEYTRQMTLQDFNTQITPIVRQVMEARGAGIVLDSGAAQLVLPAYNASDDVIARLNQNLRTMTVTRRTAPPPPAQQGASQ
jgi:outer membrane protein